MPTEVPLSCTKAPTTCAPSRPGIVAPASRAGSSFAADRSRGPAGGYEGRAWRSGPRAVDEQVARLGPGELHRGRTHGVGDGPRVITVLPVGRVHAAELPEAAHEVGLALEHQAPGDPRHLAERGPAEVLLVDHGLRAHQLFVEAPEREPRRQHRVL